MRNSSESKTAFLRDDSIWEFKADTIHHFPELVIWSARLSGVKRAKGPLETNGCNPVYVNGRIFASIWSPGQVRAFDAETGDHCWTSPLDSYAPQSLLTTPEHLVSATYRTLVAMDPASGRVEWSYTPLDSQDGFAAPPVYSNSRVVWADHGGRVYCVDASTGSLIWKYVAKSLRRKRGANATPLVTRDRVVVALARDIIVCLALENGAELWRNRTPPHSVFDVHLHNGLAIVGTRQSVVGYDSEGGTVQYRRTWPRDEIDALETCDDFVFVALDNQFGVRNLPPGKKQPPSHARLAVIGQGGEYTLKYPIYACPALRWCEETRLLYEATQQGIGIVDPARRRRVAAIKDIEPDVVRGFYCDHTTLPLVIEDRLYFLTSHHTLACIKNPVATSRRLLDSRGAAYPVIK